MAKNPEGHSPKWWKKHPQASPAAVVQAVPAKKGFLSKFNHPGWKVALSVLAFGAATLTPELIRVVCLCVAVGLATWAFHNTEFARRRLWRSGPAFLAFLVVAVGLFFGSQFLDHLHARAAIADNKPAMPLPKRAETTPPISEPAKGALVPTVSLPRTSERHHYAARKVQKASLTTPVPAPTVGILGGKNSLVRNSRVDGYQIGIDQSRSDTGVVDHTEVVGPPNTKPATTDPAVPGNAKKHKDLSYAQRLDGGGPSIDMGTASYIVFDHMIFEGTADIKNTDHVAIVNSEVILPSEAHQARMNVMNVAVMTKIRNHRNDPAWLRGYLAKMRAFFETRWTTLPRSRWDENENLFSDFEDSAEGFLFDEQKSIVLLDKLVEELPAAVQP